MQAVEDSNRPLKDESPYLKLLPREYSGPRHIVSVSQHPDERCEYEERPGAPPPPDQGRLNDANVMTIYFVRAPDAADEIR